MLCSQRTDNQGGRLLTPGIGRRSRTTYRDVFLSVQVYFIAPETESQVPGTVISLTGHMREHLSTRLFQNVRRYRTRMVRLPLTLFGRASAFFACSKYIPMLNCKAHRSSFSLSHSINNPVLFQKQINNTIVNRHRHQWPTKRINWHDSKTRQA